MKSIIEDENDFENQQNLYSDDICFDGEDGGIDSTVVLYDKKESNRLEIEANRLLNKEEEIISTKHIFNPERLKTNKQKNCLAYLNKNLDKSYQIFCKPFFGSDNPDFVVLREGKKVLLIKVCENDKKEYSEKIAKTYKNNITKIYIPELVESFEGNNKGWYLIKAVVWHNNNLQKGDFYKSLNETLNPSYNNEKNNFRLDKNLKKKFLEFLEEKYFLVDQSTRYKNIPQWADLTSSQKRLSESREGKHQKIKGVAGSGKTIVLSNRAINAHKRTKKRVLILVYNTSIIPHIQKIITEILGGTFNNFDFCIQNYHGFINSQLNNNSIKYDIEKLENQDYLKNLNIYFPKYEAIFVDEIQDYSQEWIDIIKNNFLEKNGEFVVFGDEKQGIYKGEELKICPEIKRWSNLSENKTFRLPPKISKLVTKFQNHFLKDEYTELEEISSQEGMFNGYVSYFEFQKNESIQRLSDKIQDIIKNNSKNTVILSSGEKILKKINSGLKLKEIKTLTTFVSDEFEKKIVQGRQKDAFLGDKKRSLRSEFSMNTDTIKLSTTYSFKGYEADTVIVVIQSWEQNDELLYTALTRAKESLIILNIGNNRYEQFFQKNSTLLEEKPFKFTVYEIQKENIQLKEKISEKKINEHLLSRDIKNLENKNKEIVQEKEIYLERINILEEEISHLEKEVLEKNKITNFLKKDSEESIKLKKKIEKLKEEKKEIKNSLKNKTQDLEKLYVKYNDEIKKEKLYFDEELIKQKKEFEKKIKLKDQEYAEKIKLKDQEYEEYIKQININNNYTKDSIQDCEEKVFEIILFGKIEISEELIKKEIKKISKQQNIKLKHKVIASKYDEAKRNAEKLRPLLLLQNKGDYIVLIGAHPHSLIGVDKKSKNSFTTRLQEIGDEFILEVRKNQKKRELDSIRKTNLSKYLNDGIKLLKKFNK